MKWESGDVWRATWRVMFQEYPDSGSTYSFGVSDILNHQRLTIEADTAQLDDVMVEFNLTGAPEELKQLAEHCAAGSLQRLAGETTTRSMKRM